MLAILNTDPDGMVADSLGFGGAGQVSVTLDALDGPDGIDLTPFLQKQ